MMQENIGIGTDIIEIERIQNAILRFSKKFLDKLFTEKEQRYCLARKDYARHFAGRFAAKEAIIKSLGGLPAPATWLDIEVISLESGAPQVRLSQTLCNLVGEVSTQISISHCKNYATAFAICMRSANRWTSENLFKIFLKEYRVYFQQSIGDNLDSFLPKQYQSQTIW